MRFGQPTKFPQLAVVAFWTAEACVSASVLACWAKLFVSDKFTVQRMQEPMEIGGLGMFTTLAITWAAYCRLNPSKPPRTRLVLCTFLLWLAIVCWPKL
jgi:hypothetical protein